jgi:peptide/nickel transport system substrate-binding protein
VATGSGHAGGTFTVRLMIDYTTLDSIQDNIPQARDLQRLALDSLLAVGKVTTDVSPLPYIATSWTDSPTAVTFKLRTDAKCSDGAPLTTDAVLQSFKRLITTRKSNASLQRLFGDGPYAVSANNKLHTFTFRVGTPFRDLLYWVGNQLITCPAGIAAFDANPNTALTDKLYGSGAYNLVSAVHGDQVVFKKRPEWKWGPKGVNNADMPDTFIWKVVLNDTTAANLLLTGGLDAGPVAGPDVDRLIKESSLTRKVVKGPNISDLFFSMKPGRPFAGDVNDKLREAVITAIDPKIFIEAAYAGYADPSPMPVPPYGECYDKSFEKLVPTPSVDKAKQILQQAGYTLVGGKLAKDGKQLPKINFLTPADLSAGNEYVYGVLNSLGFDLDWNNVISAAYGTLVLAGNFDLLIRRGSSDAFPLGTLASFHGSSTSNFASIGVGDPKEPGIERNFRFGLRNIGKTSCKYYQAAFKQLIEKHYNRTFAFPQVQWFLQKGVEYFPGIPSAQPFYYTKVNK